MPLSDTAIKNAKPGGKAYKMFDLGGLFLLVTPNGGKWWRFKYRFGGKEKSFSLGVYPEINLKEARRRRDLARERVARGVDPSQQRKQAKEAKIVERKRIENNFEYVGREWFDSYSPRITPKHADRLLRYLEKVFFPVIGHMPVDEIEPLDILKVVRPIEAKGHVETSHKMIRLAGQVLEYARIIAKVKYNVANGLGKILRPIQVTNRAAITESEEIGLLLRDIDEYEGYYATKFFLKILPYVFTRSTELRLARWDEFDFDEALWRIPVSRMKMRREHIVPLAPQVMDILDELRDFSGSSEHLFPSARAYTATISDVTALAALRRLGYTKEQMSVHGFRAMASTRLNELGFRPDVIEAQLAHKDKDAVRLAYNRAEYLEERRKMMCQWADYLDGLRAAKD